MSLSARVVWALAPLLLVLAVLGVLHVAGQPPSPGPVTGCSEERAKGTVALLADEIGIRRTGSAAAASAAEKLAALARAIPGVEVDVQRRDGAAPFLFFPSVSRSYRMINVVARLP